VLDRANVGIGGSSEFGELCNNIRKAVHCCCFLASYNLHLPIDYIHLYSPKQNDRNYTLI